LIHNAISKEDQLQEGEIMNVKNSIDKTDIQCAIFHKHIEWYMEKKFILFL